MFWAITAFALVTFAVLWLWIRSRLAPTSYYFDPQDTYFDNNQSLKLPLSARTATFEPMLKHYVGVTQLLVTVAAASIAFGGNNHPIRSVGIAKVLLAWSIFYGVVFCAMLIWRYDEYAQDSESYTRNWYAAVRASGFSTIICFMLGYFTWGWGLLK